MSSPNHNGSHPAPETDARTLELYMDDWHRVLLRDERGNTFADVRVVPLFPLTEPEHWIAICDHTGRELACIRDPLALPAASRAVLELALARRVFLPIIRRITLVSGHGEPCEWQVETDRGPTHFVLASEEHVRRLGSNQVAVTDSTGLRYLIDDVTGLDHKSRRVVEWYV